MTAEHEPRPGYLGKIKAREIKIMKVTQGQFDQKLVEILSGMTGAQLLSIPGIYEILAEEFNNDVLDALNEE